jgi:hypothetical protein
MFIHFAVTTWYFEQETQCLFNHLWLLIEKLTLKSLLHTSIHLKYYIFGSTAGTLCT